MSAPLILAVGAVYLFVAWDQAMKGHFGMALAWAGHAVENVGLAWAAK